MLSKLLRMLAILAAAAPVLAFIIGLLSASLIPGCKVDEGSGGHGCIVLGTDFSGAIAFLEFGGFVGMFLGIPLGIVLLVLAAIVASAESRAS